MSYLGSWKIDDALTFPAITHRFDTGALTDADSVPSYRVYEDETGTAILTGSMAKLDDTNTTGFYSEAVTLSAANGFEKGKCYTIYITAAVNSVTGGSFHTFQIEAEVDANTVSDAAGVRSAVGLVSANLDTQLSTIATYIDTEVSAIYTRIGAPAGATIAADIASIKSDTSAVLEDTGTVGVVVASVNDKTGYRLDSTGSAALTEGYRANGATGTLPQLLYEVLGLLGEKAVSGTTLTTRKLDHSTAAATFTLDDSVNPSSITRAT